MRPLLILPIAVICLAHSLKAVSQTKEEFDNLIFYIPQGLSASKTPNSMILTDATAGNGQSFAITVNKSVVSFKKMEKGFPQFWHESLVMDGFDNPAEEPRFVKFQNTSGWSCFRGGKLVSYNDQSTPAWYHLTVMRFLGTTVKIVTKCSSEELFMQKLSLLMQLVASVNFKSPPPQNTQQTVSSNPNNPARQTSSGNPGSNQSIQIKGLYISVQGDLLYNAELSILYFSPDGTVFTDIPEKGFFNFNMQDQRVQFPELFGSFTTVNNSISVKMNNKANEAIYSIEPDGSIRANNSTGQPFRKIEPLDYYQFEGTFINRQDAAAGNKTITFYKDGRFSDNGLIKTILPKANETFSEGSGNYTSKQNSLSLQYSNGHQLQLCFYMMPEDFQQAGQPGKILINNYVLVRQ